MRYILFLVLLCGCVTPYQPLGFLGGYSSTQLDENVFQVNFSGNEATSKIKVANYALLRSAEITLQNGYKYFKIVDAKKYEDVTSSQSISSSYGQFTAYQHNAVKPSASNTIVLFKEKPKGFSYNAKIIYDQYNK